MLQSPSRLQVAVLEAICDAYPPSHAPQMCAHRGESACKPGRPGAQECASDANRALHRTMCQDTLQGFRCGCAAGYRELEDTPGTAVCADVNECLLGDPCGMSSGERIACHNTDGSYRCAACWHLAQLHC